MLQGAIGVLQVLPPRSPFAVVSATLMSIGIRTARLAGMDTVGTANWRKPMKYLCLVYLDKENGLRSRIVNAWIAGTAFGTVASCWRRSRCTRSKLPRP